MKKLFYLLLLLGITVNYFSCKEDTVTPTSQNVITHGEYNVELLPGQIFEGSQYYYADNQINGNITDINNVSWLAITHSDISVGPGCSHWNYVLYNFTAPTTLGNYSTIGKHSSNENYNIKINLKVTNEPSVLRSDSTVFINLGDTIIRNYDDTWVGLDLSSIHNCASFYVPANTQVISYAMYPSVDWLIINPSSTSINLNNSVTISKKFIGRAVGTFTTFEVLTKQWKSWPRFRKWTIEVTQ